MAADSKRVDLNVMRGASLAVFLGSGLGSVCESFPVVGRLSFENIDGVGGAGVEGHVGEVVRCRVGDQSCVFVRGRKHYYEGDQGPIIALVAFLSRIGIDKLLLTSAAGGLNGRSPGTLMLVDSILDLQFRPPVSMVPHKGNPGPYNSAGRPGSTTAAMDPLLKRKFRDAAAAAGTPLGSGVMASLSGPAYDTPSEVRALEVLGASAIGMSAAPEAAAATARGIRVVLVAVITNWAAGTSASPLHHGEVLAAGAKSASALKRIVTHFVKITESD